MEEENKKFKIWSDKGGILRMEIGKEMDGKILEEIVKELKEISKKLPTKPKMLINLSLVPHMPTSSFRRKCVSIAKDVYNDPGFNKVALCEGKAIQKVVALFVLTATRLKNIKYLNTEEEALEWLKEE